MGAGYSTLSAQLLAMELLREGCHMPCDRSSSMSSTCAICDPPGSNRETEPAVRQEPVIRDRAAGLRGTPYQRGSGDRQKACSMAGTRPVAAHPLHVRLIDL